MGVLNYILDLGPSIVLPIIMFVLALLLRMPVGRAFRSALTIGIGFIAINLVVGLMAGTLGPTAQAMIENIGIDLPIIDVGWPVAASISFATTSVVPWIFVLGIAINLAMIALKWTKTLNVDMWNYWHFIFTSAFFHVFTGNFFISIVAGLITSIAALKLADSVAPLIQDHYGMPGITTPHVHTVGMAPLTWVINKGIDLVPGVRDLHATPENIQDRFGVMGEPMIMGSGLGLIIAALAYFPDFGTDPGMAFANVLEVGITMGAVMLLLPRMVGLLMEGLAPISEAARKFMTSKYPDRELYIGLDAAILIGHPANMSTAIIMIPITLALAVLMSLIGLNQMLPFTDLATLPFYCIWATTWHRGNIYRGTITMTILMLFILTISTFLAAPTTQLALAAGFDMPADTTIISSLDSGSHLIPFVMIFPLMFKEILALGPVFTLWTSFIVLVSIACYVIYFTKVVKGKTMGIYDKDLYDYNTSSDSTDPTYN